MKIGQLASLSGVSVQAIRFYERRGLLRPPLRRPSGYRDYSQASVEDIHFIRKAQELGYSLGEIRELLKLREQPGASAARVRAVAEAKLRGIDEKIHALQRMRRELRRIVEQCGCGTAEQSHCLVLEKIEHLARDNSAREE